MTTRRKTGVSHLHNQQPTASPKFASGGVVDAPFPLLDREFPLGTHQYSDETGEYAVDPETGKVIRKL